MEITFEGDVVDLTEIAKEACAKVIREKGFNNCTVQVQAVGKKGDNYMSTVKRFTVQQDDINNGKPFNMIVKIAPRSQKTRDFMNTDIVFQNEGIVYSELLPKYEEFEISGNICSEDRLKSAICYGINLEPPNENIILQDIKDTGHQMLSRFVSLKNDEAKLAFKELAKFHALSYVLKVRDPSFFSEMKRRLQNIWIMQDPEGTMKEYIVSIEEDTQKVLKNENFRKRVKGIMLDMLKLNADVHNADMDSQYSAIIQGDCWTNNIMYKIKDDKPVDLIFLDYQISRIASPAVDIFYLILNCTDYETRIQYFHEWLDFYYKSLEDFLSNFKIKADHVYPRNEFDADLRRHFKSSLGVSFMFANLLVRESEEVIDFQNDPSIHEKSDFGVNTMSDVTAAKYRERLEGLIQSCIELGYL